MDLLGASVSIHAKELLPESERLPDPGTVVRMGPPAVELRTPGTPDRAQTCHDLESISAILRIMLPMPLALGPYQHFLHCVSEGMRQSDLSNLRHLDLNWRR